MYRVVFDLRLLSILSPLAMLSVYFNAIAKYVMAFSVCGFMPYALAVTYFLMQKEKAGFDVVQFFFNPGKCFASLMYMGFKKTAYLGMLIMTGFIYAPIVLYFTLTPFNDWFIFPIFEHLFS